MLVVVYHESIPIWGNQCLSTQIFVVNQFSFEMICFNSSQVPIRPESQLKYFRFTQEGMILSQDTQGTLRVYNLEHNSWSSLIVEGIEDMRRLYLIGMTNY